MQAKYRAKVINAYRSDGRKRMEFEEFVEKEYDFDSLEDFKKELASDFKLPQDKIIFLHYSDYENAGFIGLNFRCLANGKYTEEKSGFFFDLLFEITRFLTNEELRKLIHWA